MNPIKKYVNTIERCLQVDKQTRLRIMRDLGSDIQARMEAGETPEAIMADMGSPETVAANFNQAFADKLQPRRKWWHWALLAAACLPLLSTVFSGLALQQLLGYVSVGEGQAMGVIGGADGPTAIFVALEVSPMAWGLGEGVCLALAGLAVFFMLIWPEAAGSFVVAGADGPTAVFCKPKRYKLWLPALLALAALVLWAVLLAGVLVNNIYGLQGADYIVVALKRFFLQGGIIAAAALYAAARRIWRARR